MLTADHIKAVPEALAAAEAGDWAACAAAMNAPTIEIPNTSPLTIGDLSKLPDVGLMGARQILGTLRAAESMDVLMAGAFVALNSTGMRLDTPERQQMIADLAASGGWADGLRDAVLSAGLSVISPAQQVGAGTAAADQLQAAWQADQQRQRADRWREQFDSAINQVNAGLGEAAADMLNTIADEMRGV